MSLAQLPLHHLRPGRRWLRVNWRELWFYRDLLGMLVSRDFSSRFRQTILGPVWYIGQPLLVTGVMMVVFNRLLRVETDGVPALLFYLSGLVVWNYFAQTIGFAGNIFHDNSNTITKVYFPRVLLPLASGISGLVGFVVQLATLVVLTGIHWLNHPPSGLTLGHGLLALGVLPLIALQSLLIALGTCLSLSALTAKYRDFQHVQPLLLQAWLYLSPVVYPLTRVPEDWRWLSQLNPLVMPVELMRWCFYGTGTFDVAALVISWGITLALVLGGLFAFQRMETIFADLN